MKTLILSIGSSISLLGDKPVCESYANAYNFNKVIAVITDRNVGGLESFEKVLPKIFKGAQIRFVTMGGDCSSNKSCAQLSAMIGVVGGDLWIANQHSTPAVAGALQAIGCALSTNQLARVKFLSVGCVGVKIEEVNASIFGD